MKGTQSLADSTELMQHAFVCAANSCMSSVAWRESVCILCILRPPIFVTHGLE